MDYIILFLMSGVTRIVTIRVLRLLFIRVFLRTTFLCYFNNI